jgi:hypothetical protein
MHLLPRTENGYKKGKKSYDIRTWKTHLFLDIRVSSTNIDTLAPSLYQCVKTRSIQVLCLLSQPPQHLRFNLFVISETFTIKAVFSGPDKWKSLGFKSGL